MEIIVNVCSPEISHSKNKNTKNKTVTVPRNTDQALWDVTELTQQPGSDQSLAGLRSARAHSALTARPRVQAVLESACDWLPLGVGIPCPRHTELS